VNVRRRAFFGLIWVVFATASLVVLEPFSNAVVGALGCAVLTAVTVTDLEARIVPNRIVIPATVAALAARTALEPRFEWLLALLAAGAFFLLFAALYPAGLGMGDVKLAAFLGAWLGWDVGVALFVGSFAALVPATATLARHGTAGRKHGIPYAPFLAAGGVVALFAGDAIVDAWLG
jgi:leader peptidase (prepilin peptidase)/N-methyltransferase